MTDLSYSPLQERAISAIVEWYGDPNGQQTFILHGYAGTGKSTVVAEAVRRLQDKYNILNIPIGVYTGKAAHVLRKKGNPNAQTIHSMIYLCVEDEETGQLNFILNPIGAAANADLIILDECSFIDQAMAKDLLSFKKRTLILGDPGQLPPINGEGAFNGAPDFFLDEIHRQSSESPIIKLATMARKGIPLPIGFHEGDVRVMKLTNTTQEHLFNPETQVLCGVHRIRWPVTQMIRQRNGFTEPVPMVGEQIMCCKNDRERGLFNGGIGTLKKLEIKGNDYVIDAIIEGNFQKKLLVDPYLFKQHFDEGASQKMLGKKRHLFDHAVCISVHKSQGSGYPHVTLIDNSPSFKEHAARHLYTAVTRAEEGLIVLIP